MMKRIVTATTGSYFVAVTIVVSMILIVVVESIVQPNCSEASTNYKYYIETCADETSVLISLGSCIDGMLKDDQSLIWSCIATANSDTQQYCHDCGPGRLVCSDEIDKNMVCPNNNDDSNLLSCNSDGPGFDASSYPCVDKFNFEKVFEQCEDGVSTVNRMITNCTEDSPDFPICSSCNGYDICSAEASDCNLMGLPSSESAIPIPTCTNSSIDHIYSSEYCVDSWNIIRYESECSNGITSPHGKTIIESCSARNKDDKYEYCHECSPGNVVCSASNDKNDICPTPNSFDSTICTQSSGIFSSTSIMCNDDNKTIRYTEDTCDGSTSSSSVRETLTCQDISEDNTFCNICDGKLLCSSQETDCTALGFIVPDTEPTQGPTTTTSGVGTSDRPIIIFGSYTILLLMSLW